MKCYFSIFRSEDLNWKKYNIKIVLSFFCSQDLGNWRPEIYWSGKKWAILFLNWISFEFYVRQDQTFLKFKLIVKFLWIQNCKTLNMEKRISSKQFLTDMFAEQYKKMMELYKTHEKSIADILHNILKKPSIGINKLSEQINANSTAQGDLSRKTKDLGKWLAVNQDLLDKNNWERH